MNKAFLFGAAAAVALLPAVIGLTSNPSLSARVPLAPTQLQLPTLTADPTSTPTTTSATPTTVPARRSEASATHRPSHTASATGTDDHGADRPAGSDSGRRGRGGADDSSGRHGRDDRG